MVDDTIKHIKTLREKTGAPILEVKKALVKTKNDIKKAEESLKEWSAKKAASKQGEETHAGIVESYIHPGGKVGSMIILTCQTDFVARTDDFKNLGREIAMQVASMNPKDEKELLKQAYIRDSKKTIEILIKDHVAKLGENITVKKITRFSI